MTNNKCPEIGTKMYFVLEHRYRCPEDYYAILLEYIVQEAEVVEIFQGSNNKIIELKLLGKGTNGGLDLWYFRLSDIGRRLFPSAREAALQAQQLTEERELHWGWLGEPDMPMRRPWQNILE